MSEATTRPVTRPNAIAWPPALYLVAFLGGLAMNGLIPFGAPNGAAARLIGAGIVGLGAGISLCTLREVHRYGTNYTALREARCIIRTGPFSFTRNPMYLAMALLLVGLGLLLNNLWVVVSALPVIVIISRVVVRNEERVFENAFGDTYREYRRSVRRWL